MTPNERGAAGSHSWLVRLGRAALGKPRITRVAGQGLNSDKHDDGALAGGLDELRARIERRTAAKPS